MIRYDTLIFDCNTMEMMRYDTILFDNDTIDVNSSEFHAEPQPSLTIELTPTKWSTIGSLKQGMPPN